MTRWCNAAVLVLLTLASGGCVADKSYRFAQQPLYEKLKASQFDPTQTPGVEGSYRLAFMEFNDRGQVFEAAQSDRAVEHIKLARARRPASQAFVVVFVHGWHHNASQNDANVWGFRQLLAGMAVDEPDREITGIYVGWRGESSSLPGVTQATFFDRHRASQRVPVPVMPDVLDRMIKAAKDPDGSTTPATIVFIGHSFGGAVLETAITPLLDKAIDDAREAAKKDPRSLTVKWPADMVMLLNEAQEAERSAPLITRMRRELTERAACAPPGTTANNLRPAVISISSTGDLATRGLFPGARVLSRPFNRLPPNEKLFGVGRRQLHYATTAHISKLRSHVIGRHDDLKADPQGRNAEPPAREALSACMPTLHATLSYGVSNIGYSVVERPGAQNRTPYWVMHMPRSIVPDHSTIFTQVFRDFVKSLLMQALLDPPHDQLRPSPLTQ